MDTIKSLSDLHKFAGEVDEEWTKEWWRPWWRGQDCYHWSRASARWRLLPGVYRTEEDRINEVKNHNEFRLQAKSRWTACPGGDNNVGWLCLAQHQGLPTRLLDWPVSHLVAIYFAVRDRNLWERDGVLWALNPVRLNAESGMRMLLPGESPIREVAWPAFSESPVLDKRVLAFMPQHIDMRMTNQHTVFTIHGNDAMALDEQPDKDAFLRRFRIPAKQKTDIEWELRLSGVLEHILFPDLDGLARHLRFRTRSSTANGDREASPGGGELS